MPQAVTQLIQPPFQDKAKHLMAGISRQLIAKRWTITTAESCTSGLVANCLTLLSGSSQYFQGAVVAYAADRKQQVLGVSAETIALHGVVSEQVAAEMAQGACQLMASTMAVATTGVLGPNPEQDGTAAGVLCLAIHHSSKPGRSLTVSLTADDRHANLNQATIAALQMIADFLADAA